MATHTSFNAAFAPQLLALFDELPHTPLFVKDRLSRYIKVNEAFVVMLHGRHDVSHVLGKTDHHFYPPALASEFVAEDRTVMKTGKPLRDHVCLVPDQTGLPSWYHITKIPLVDRQGVISAIGGILRPFDHAGSAPREYKRLTPVMEHVLVNHGAPITAKELARRAGLSVSQLQREFRRLFRMSPGDYVLRVRLLMARRRLEETTESVGHIALECGFYDQSHFTRTFRAHTGMTPLEYRHRFQS